MQKLQMNKLKDTAKKINSHGITLMSLIIYITIMMVILALIMRVTTYYTKNIKDVADITFETEFEKFNMYMLQETKKSNNFITEHTNNSITFSDENTLSFQDENLDGEGEIYFNDIKICEYVNECIFTVRNDNETAKTSVVVDITIHETEKQTTYVLQNISDDVEASKEKDYTIKTNIPKAYQEVEYIESDGTQYINTGIVVNNSNFKHMHLIIDEDIDGGSSWMLNGSSDNANNAIYVGVHDKTFYYGIGNDKSTSITYNSDTPDRCIYDLDVKNAIYSVKNVQSGNEIVRVNTVENENKFDSVGLPIWLMGYSGENIKHIGKIYSAQIYIDDIIARNLIPCYRKSDGETGMFDTVTEQFYTNQGTGEFLKGPDVD